MVLQTSARGRVENLYRNSLFLYCGLGLKFDAWMTIIKLPLGMSSNVLLNMCT